MNHLPPTRRITLLAALAWLGFPHHGPYPIDAHGQITFPPSSRTNGSLPLAGSCENHACFWFTQPTEIPGPPTVNAAEYRTVNVQVSGGGTADWSRHMPWRAPGTAPVRGSGCGVAGGSPFVNMTGNGGVPPPGVAQGADGLTLPAKPPTQWLRGGVADVAWAMLANHGGGYSWRLCPVAGEGAVNEACFQRHPLRFANERHTMRWGNSWQWGRSAALPNVTIPMVRVTAGTHPVGSEWARNPIPACNLCDQGALCMAPESNLTWLERQHCSQACSGFNLSHCPPGLAQFAPPADGLSGYYVSARCMSSSPNGLQGFPYSIVDSVHVPADLPAGRYLLSWYVGARRVHPTTPARRGMEIRDDRAGASTCAHCCAMGGGCVWGGGGGGRKEEATQATRRGYDGSVRARV